MKSDAPFADNIYRFTVRYLVKKRNQDIVTTNKKVVVAQLPSYHDITNTFQLYVCVVWWSCNVSSELITIALPSLVLTASVSNVTCSSSVVYALPYPPYLNIIYVTNEAAQTNETINFVSKNFIIFYPSINLIFENKTLNIILDCKTFNKFNF